MRYLVIFIVIYKEYKNIHTLYIFFSQEFFYFASILHLTRNLKYDLGVCKTLLPLRCQIIYSGRASQSGRNIFIGDKLTW